MIAARTIISFDRGPRLPLRQRCRLRSKPDGVLKRVRGQYQPPTPILLGESYQLLTGIRDWFGSATVKRHANAFDLNIGAHACTSARSVGDASAPALFVPVSPVHARARGNPFAEHFLVERLKRSAAFRRIRTPYAFAPGKDEIRRVLWQSSQTDRHGTPKNMAYAPALIRPATTEPACPGFWIFRTKSPFWNASPMDDYIYSRGAAFRTASVERSGNPGSA